MANLRKEQLKLAVLMEVGEKPKKNGYIVKDAEKRLNPDETYNRMMLNGKQTKGMKELQFILYDFKKEEVVEMVSRGVFKESGRTWNNRMDLIFSIKEKIESGEIKAEEILLNEKTLDEIKDIYSNNIGWERKPEPERKIIAEKKETEKETSDTGIESQPADVSGGLDFSSLENKSETKENVLYDNDFMKVTEDENGELNIDYKFKRKNETDGKQVDNFDSPEVEDKDGIPEGETTDDEKSDIDNDGVGEPAEGNTENNVTLTEQVENNSDTENVEEEPKQEKSAGSKKSSSKKGKNGKNKKK